jgi:hypothetical protein
MQWRPVVSSSIVVAAIAVAVVEAPERAVRLYGEWFYPRLQATLTTGRHCMRDAGRDRRAITESRT